MSVTLYILNRNYGIYLERAIKSALNQSHQDIEIFIIDDASEDNSKNVLQKYKNNKKLNIIENKESIGLVKNANKALNISTKEYIIRLDADDILYPFSIENLYKCAVKDNEIGIVYGNYNLTDPEGNVLKRRIRLPIDENNKFLGSPCHGACTLFKTQSLNQIGGYCEKFNRQDGVYAYYSLVANGWKVKNLSEIIFDYTQHKKSLSSDTLALHKVKADILEDIVKKFYQIKKATVVISISDIESLLNCFSNNSIFLNNLESSLKEYSEFQFVDRILIIVNNKNYFRKIKLSKKIEIIEISKEFDAKNYKNKLFLKIKDLISSRGLSKNEIILMRNVEYYNTPSYYAKICHFSLIILRNFRSIITVRRINEVIMANTGGELVSDQKSESELFERDERFTRSGGIFAFYTQDFLNDKEPNFFKKPTFGVEIEEFSSVHISSKLQKLIQLNDKN